MKPINDDIKKYIDVTPGDDVKSASEEYKVTLYFDILDFNGDLSETLKKEFKLMIKNPCLDPAFVDITGLTAGPYGPFSQIVKSTTMKQEDHLDFTVAYKP